MVGLEDDDPFLLSPLAYRSWQSKGPDPREPHPPQEIAGPNKAGY